MQEKKVVLVHFFIRVDPKVNISLFEPARYGKLDENA